MARYVTTSIVTGHPTVADPHDPEQAIAKALETWDERLGLVWPDKPDLIVLPEYCDRPVLDIDPVQGWAASDIERWLEARGDRLLQFFAAQAATHGAHIAYSSLRRDQNGQLRNSTLIIDDAGAVVGTYDKVHCTAGELARGIRPGEAFGVTETSIGRVAPLICFDLNFDEHIEQLRVLRPDIVLFSSAYHGGLMQPYWAYALRAWFIGSIRPPSDSQILSPVGDVRATTVNYRSHVTTRINLDHRVIHIDYNERRFKDIKGKYGRDVQIFDPGLLGAVLLTSERDGLDVQQVMDEFDLVELDDYFRPFRR